MSDSGADSANVPASLTSSTADTFDGRSQRSIRTASILLFLGAGVGVIVWSVQSHWGMKLEPVSLVETAVQVLLAVGLRRFGRRAILPTLVFLSLTGLLPVIRAALTLDVPAGMPSVVVYGVVLLFALLRILPFVLLFLRRQSQATYATGVGIFVLYELIIVLRDVMIILVAQRFFLR